MFNFFIVNRILIFIGEIIFLSRSSPVAHVEIAGMFPVLDTKGYQEKAAFVLALKQINDKRDGVADYLLPRTTIKYTIQNSYNTYLGSLEDALSMELSSFNGTGIIACIGAAFDIESEAIAQVFNAFYTNQISYGSTASALSYAGPYPRFFRTCTSEAAQSIALADLVYNYFKWERVSLFYTSDSYGSDGGYVFQQEAAAHGIKILSNHIIQSGQQDMSSFINAALSTGTRIFVLFMASHDANVLLRQGYQLGLFREGTQILGSGFMTTPSLWANMTPDMANTILKGYIGLTPAFGMNLTFNQTFVNHWRAQKNTIHRFPNGTVVCDGSLDDDGKLLYKYGKHGCSGLDFSTFDANGSDLAPYASFSYDATFALASALHFLLYVKGLDDVTPDDLTNALQYNTSFIGTSGLVSFRYGDPNTGYGFGDRLHDFKFRVLNYHPPTGSATFGSLVTAGVWYEGHGFRPCTSPSCNLQFRTSDNSIPMDTPPVIYQSISPGLKALLAVEAALCVIVVLAFTAFVILQWKSRLVRAAQPKMLLLVLLGGLLGCMRVINSLLNVTDKTCVSGTWLAHLCFCLVTCSLCAKTWRVRKVMTAGFKKVSVGENQAVGIVVLVMLCVCVYLGIITAVAKPRQAYISKDLGKLQIEKYSECTSSSPYLGIGLYAVEAGMLMYGWLLSWASKNIPDSINEGKHIALGEYGLSGRVEELWGC